MKHSKTTYSNIINQTINATFKYQVSQQYVKLKYEKIKISNAFSNSLTITKYTTLNRTIEQIFMT